MSEILKPKKNPAPEVAHRYPTRSEVEEANTTRLAQIAENATEFEAIDRPGFDKKGKRVPLRKMAQLLNRLVALQTVALKVI